MKLTKEFLIARENRIKEIEGEIFEKWYSLHDIYGEAHISGKMDKKALKAVEKQIIALEEQRRRELDSLLETIWE